MVLKQWLLDFSIGCTDDMADARYNSKKSLIDSAKDYVHRNYRSVDLGLDDTCKELGVSNSYFSSLFKEGNRQLVCGVSDSLQNGQGCQNACGDRRQELCHSPECRLCGSELFQLCFSRESMGFPHPGTGQSMRRIRYKSGNIQSIIMLSFSLLSFAIMLVTVVVMYIKFA